MVSQLLPHDHQHFDRFSFAMERTARIDHSAPPVPLLDVYQAVLRRLSQHYREGIPLGTFVRLLRAVGVAVAHEGVPQGNVSRYAYKLRLLKDTADDQ
ncbi:hypothetical protein ACOZDZ_18000 [Streptomyces griseoincarnatus]|uniref:hypothetical protein n=1 Tax=Streptomyces sp. E2N171 TaxID=1851914 RepID=UPI000EF5CD14|nr:hypothetical protein [Streptomyces sp. E2N171]